MTDAFQVGELVAVDGLAGSILEHAIADWWVVQLATGAIHYYQAGALEVVA